MKITKLIFFLFVRLVNIIDNKLVRIKKRERAGRRAKESFHFRLRTPFAMPSGATRKFL